MGGPWDVDGLRVIGECLTDAKKARVSAQNRETHGGVVTSLEKGLLVGPAKGLEEFYEKRLMEEYARVVPGHVRAFLAGVPGLGTGVLPARIMSSVGNPRWAVPYERVKNADGKYVMVPDGEPHVRSLRQLWQYCGCGDPLSNPRSDILGHEVTQKDKLRGGKRETTRSLLYAWSSQLALSASVVTKEGSSFFGRPRSQAAAASRYWEVFEKAKADGLGKVHDRQCQNNKRPPFAPNGCGTKANPEWGAPGSLWRKGHAQAHAHRIVHKEFLRDLWEICGDA